MRYIALILLLSVLFMTSGCSESVSPTTTDNPSASGGEPSLPPSPKYTLTFEPVPVEPLTETDAPVELIKAKSFGLQRISGQKNVYVHLYVDPQFRDNPEQGEVIAYLQDGSVQYNLGMVTDYGIANADVRADDVTGDKLAEIVLSGTLGSHYEERKVIGFDGERKEWVLYLQTGSPVEADLDGDGQPELLAVSKGSVPSYVWLYRWQGGRFVMADFAKATGSQYARLVERDDYVLIETGRPGTNHLYRYDQGALFEIDGQE
ncbi:MAG: hypothetical protein H0Z34_06335 [Brevibacillus sp.]|nr:hypothetical protein [Brevibacillus sp.]